MTSLLCRAFLLGCLAWGGHARLWAIAYDWRMDPPNLGALDRDGTLLVVDDIREADFGEGLRLPVRFVYRGTD